MLRIAAITANPADGGQVDGERGRRRLLARLSRRWCRRAPSPRRARCSGRGPSRARRPSSSPRGRRCAAADPARSRSRCRRPRCARRPPVLDTAIVSDAAARHRVEAVGDQVQQRQLELHGVGQHRRETVGDREVEPHAGAVSFGRATSHTR